MAPPERSVLHVLPHPGGGGETYVDLLEVMSGYRFERMYLGSSPEPSMRELAGGAAHAYRRAHKHDVVHVHGEAAAGLCLPLLATRPSVVTLHGLHLVRRLSGLPQRAAVLNLRVLLRAADRTICVSEAEHDELVRVAGSSAGARSVVIRNGVRRPEPVSEDRRTAIRYELGIGSEKPLAIWIGSLDERKDPLTAVHAANDVGVALLVVGEGPLRTEVDRAASEHVRVVGPRADIDRLLTAADIFVLTSHREGLSFSLLEAMAHGLAPVVTSLPENLEAVGDGGVAVHVDDLPALSTALARLAHNDDERRALGKVARTRSIDLFDVAGMVSATKACYGALWAAGN